MPSENEPRETSEERLRELVERLTTREQDVWKLLAEDLTYGQIGEQLSITDHTVRSHVARINEKLEVAGRMGAARLYWVWLHSGTSR